MENSSVDFSKGEIMPLILKFSIPAAISLLISAIYNIVDRMFVGNFVGNTELAALSICFPLSFMMIAFGLMCSAGGSTLFTMFRGEGNQDTANRTFTHAFVMNLVFEIVLMIVLLSFPDFFLHIFGVTATTYEGALTYYKIVSLGCIFQGLTFCYCDYVRVSGMPVLGMMVTGIGAVTNIILDAVFVAGLHLGISGAAWATVIGQIVSFVFGSVLLFSGKTLVEIRKKYFSPNVKLALRILNCGFTFWIAQMAMGFIALVYNGCLGTYGGDVAISSYAIISSMMTFLIMPASGISMGIQPLVSFNYSSGHKPRVMKIFFQATGLSVLITTFIWLVIEIFPAAVIQLFGGGAQLLEIGIPALRYNFIIAPLLGFIMLATTFFQSLDKAVASSIITLLRQVVVLVPLIYILPRHFGTIGIFWAQPISDLLATVISAILIYRTWRDFTKK